MELAVNGVMPVASSPAFPTDDELVSAVNAAKEQGYGSQDIITTDEAAGVVRHFLGPKWHHLPLDRIRKECFHLSKAGKEPGERKRNGEANSAGVIDRLINKFEKFYPRQESHSAEYDAMHSGETFRTIVARLKDDMDHRCQCCRRQRTDLEGHVLDYTKFFLPGFVLVLCAEKCHPLVDSMRRWGLATEKGEPDLTIFGMDEGQS